MPEDRTFEVEYKEIVTKKSKVTIQAKDCFEALEKIRSACGNSLAEVIEIKLLESEAPQIRMYS